LHWDEWLGPAPYREYHDGLHPFHWRSWRQFGTGTIGDMACHNLDPAFWALKLGRPERIEAWIDDKRVVNQDIRSRQVDTRIEVELSKPLGIASWETRAAVRNIRLRMLGDDEARGEGD
jgi:predicted dehydrogenase